MEESTNLLDDFVKPEFDLEDYRKSYEKYRRISLLFTFFIFLVYIVFMDKAPKKEFGILYVIGTALGILLVIVIPSSFIAVALSIIIDKKFPFSERYKRLFWITSLWVGGFIALCLIFNLILPEPS
jgi:hypothetical protein